MPSRVSSPVVEQARVAKIVWTCPIPASLRAVFHTTVSAPPQSTKENLRKMCAIRMAIPFLDLPRAPARQRDYYARPAGNCKVLAGIFRALRRKYRQKALT